jgi:pimeloyl-ACP methyl ester carboxylesterase
MRKYRDTSRDAEIREKGLTAFIEGTAAADDVFPENDPREREAILADWSDGEAAIAMLNWYRATPLAVPPPNAPFEIPKGAPLPKVPQLTIPTLVVWAMQDHALTPNNIIGLDEHIADLTLKKIPNCGHFVTWGAPYIVNSAMDEFLSRPS